MWLPGKRRVGRFVLLCSLDIGCRRLEEGLWGPCLRQCQETGKIAGHDNSQVGMGSSCTQRIQFGLGWRRTLLDIGQVAVIPRFCRPVRWDSPSCMCMCHPSSPFKSKMICLHALEQNKDKPAYGSHRAVQADSIPCLIHEVFVARGRS